MHRTDVRHLLAGSLWLWFLAATAPVASAQSHGFTARDMLEVAVASVLDLTEDGRRVAVAIRRPADNAETDHRRFGDPTYLSPAFVRLAIIDTRSGRTHEPFKWLVHVRQAAWTRDGERLALLLAEPADSPDGLPRTRLYVWHAAQPPARALREVEIKGEARVSLNSDLEWTADGSRLIATLRTVDQDREAGLRFRALTEAPVIVHASSEPFLEWDDLRRLDRMREIVHIDPATGAVTTKVPRARIASYRVARDGSFITIAEDVTEKTDYDTIFGSLNTLRYVGADGTTRTVADGKDLKDVQVRWSDDGRSLAYSKKGDVFVQKIDEEKPRQVTGKKGDPDEGAGEVDGPDARRRDDGGQLAPLVRDSNLYQNIRYSHDGSTVVYSMSDGDRPAELYVADASFRNARKLTDLNPWIASKSLPRSELVSYRDADGKVLYGVLRYPVNYQKGQTYPTVFEIYETFFDNGFNGRAALLANHGYAVFHPSVNLVVGRPGDSWAKGVTAAANKLIDMGVADPDRLGVHGTSYGGYATVLLLTETDRFKAAINISGKVNMVSFYTDSPRLGVRNTHAPEKSQDRIGGTLWEYPERYLDHSAIMRADRIKTPLLNITGDQDPNVPASQSREIYYALRRLGRDVEWVRYVDGGHRPPNSVSESIDFENRILKWYDNASIDFPDLAVDESW
jgi:dienelactone hydrolase